MINKLKTKKAFTIIEVVLVLGIAGLIILAMFIAIPALQRSKRNQIRQDDMLRIMKAVVSYQGNHSGKIPILISGVEVKFDGSFPKEYIDSGIDSDSISRPESVIESAPGKVNINTYGYTCSSADGCTNFVDPDGSPYKINATSFDGHDVRKSTDDYIDNFDHYIHFVAFSRCASTSDGEITKSNNANDLSIVYVKENGVAFCVDNQ